MIHSWWQIGLIQQGKEEEKQQKNVDNKRREEKEKSQSDKEEKDRKPTFFGFRDKLAKLHLVQDNAIPNIVIIRWLHKPSSD